jgi:hypothetical protein
VTDFNRANVLGTSQDEAVDVGIRARVFQHLADQERIDALEARKIESARFAQKDRGNSVVDSAAKVSEPVMLFRLVPSVNDVVVGPSRVVNQSRNLFGGVLEVVVHDDDVVARGSMQARHHGVVLAKVPRQPDVNDVLREFVCQRFTHGVTLIGAPIVDQHNLYVFTLQNLKEATNKRTDGLRPVVDGNNDTTSHGRISHEPERLRPGCKNRSLKVERIDRSFTARAVAIILSCATRAFATH